MHNNLANTPPVEIENAVRETMQRVSTNAFLLLTRQSEINRRIRDLHRVIRHLRRWAVNSKFSSGEMLAAHRAPENDFDVAEHDSLRKSPSLVQSRRSLSRACRIALLEAGGPASLDEIRVRILRRRSFSFPDATMTNMAILRALTRMTSAGEILCSERNSHKLWRRIEWPAEGDCFPGVKPSA
jgi:hypothetical protein